MLGSGDTLLMGRAPDTALPAADADALVNVTALTLPRVAPHVSRVGGEVQVGEEVVRLRWRGSTSAQLSSLFDAPGGARRVSLSDGMAALLDEGENHLLILRGRQTGPREFTDLVVVLDVEEIDPPEATTAWIPAPGEADGAATADAPHLERWSREWYVALALTEPWLIGDDDYPRPPSNREIYEQILAWRGHAWNLERAQRVDDAIRSVARLAFGPADDPFATTTGRVQNVRFAVGRRIAEVGLVTTADLEAVLQARADGTALNPGG